MLLPLSPNARLSAEKVMELFDPGVVKGFRFCATMNMSTPLRILRRHGEISREIPQDWAVDNMGQGCWVIETKSFAELGIKLPDLQGKMASSWGPIPSDGGQVLPFLIRYRTLVESVNPVSERRKQLVEFAAQRENAKYFEAEFDYLQRILDWDLPRFIDTLPYLNLAQRNQLEANGILSANQVLDNLDALRALKGIGEKRIAEFRKLCEACATPDDEYIDKIIR